ncbi:MAG: ABC transporter substrate-binding protein, partial [Ktedonobacteraceae bacterium]
MEDLLQGRLPRRDFLARAGALGVSLSSLGALLEACGGGSNSPTSGNSTTLKFANWASAESATRDNINKALKVFESSNNVTIQNIGIPFDQVLQQLTTMTNGGNPPDVMQLSGNWPYALGGSGALEPLDAYVNSDWKSDAFTNSFEVGSYKGKTYAVPFTVTPHGFWYSKDLMQKAGLDASKPPKTIDELNQMMATLRAKLPSDAYP